MALLASLAKRKGLGLRFGHELTTYLQLSFTNFLLFRGNSKLALLLPIFFLIATDVQRFFQHRPRYMEQERDSFRKCILHPTVSKCSSSKFLDEPTSFPLRFSASVGSQSRIDRCCRACLERTGLASSTARGGQGKILSSRVSFFLFLFLSFFI